MLLNPRFQEKLLETLTDAVYVLDREGRITFWNRAAEELTGYTREDVLGRHCREGLLCHLDEVGRPRCGPDCPTDRTIQDGREREEILSTRHADGHRVPVVLRTAPFRDEHGRITGGVGVMRAHHAASTVEHHLRDLAVQAYVDPLTGLPNRRGAEPALLSRLEEQRRYGWRFGALLVDLDHFKLVHDRFGHAVGDALLRAVDSVSVRDGGPRLSRAGGGDPVPQEEITDRIAALEERIAGLREELGRLRREECHGPFPDHGLTDRDGKKVRLSDLFGDRDDLLVVHNMGTGCPYCTLWADGLDGVLAHLESRAAFVVVSPDEPETQRRFADSRGWRFRMLSAKGTSFTRDARFEGEDGSPWPGVTAFRKDDHGRIVRVSRAPFGPGDEFCAVWHLFGLLADGAGGWTPRFRYD